MTDKLKKVHIHYFFNQDHVCWSHLMFKVMHSSDGSQKPNILTDQPSVSQPFLPRGTLGQQYHCLAASLDAKTGLKDNESDNWRHP